MNRREEKEGKKMRGGCKEEGGGMEEVEEKRERGRLTDWLIGRLLLGRAASMATGTLISVPRFLV